MARFASVNMLEQGPKYLKDNCDKVILLKDYTSNYTTANTTSKVAECALVTDDFAFSAGVDVTGTATAGGASTLTDSAKAWTTNEHAGRTIDIISGTGVGQSRVISSNTGTAVTVSSAWTTQPSTDSVYKIGVPRILTAALNGKSAGNALMAVSDGSNMHLAFVKTGTSEVIYVIEESGNQVVANGNPVNLTSNATYASNQPTA